MSHGKPYTVFKRINSRIYYAQFKLPDGRWSTAKSTGETSKGRAEAWAIDYLSAGQIVQHENVTLAEFSKDFFTWEGSWATDKRVRGLRIGRRQCYNLTYLLKNHLIPRLGEMRLTNVNRAAIREFRNGLTQYGYSGNSINKMLSALKMILEAAEDQALIQHVPRIERAADNPRRKGILTIEEVKQLFSTRWMSHASHCHPARDNFMGYAGNLLACSTGLRMSEVLALVLSDIHIDQGYIHVRRSYDQYFGLSKTTKTGKCRNIFIPGAVQAALRQLIEDNPDPMNPESFLFFSEKIMGKPAEPIVFTKRSLYPAMRSIGISEQERRARNLTFHSWRHFINSLMVNARIPLQKIQSVTGHLTVEMTERYYHIDDMSDVRQVQESLFN